MATKKTASKSGKASAKPAAKPATKAPAKAAPAKSAGSKPVASKKVATKPAKAAPVKDAKDSKKPAPAPAKAQATKPAPAKAPPAKDVKKPASGPAKDSAKDAGKGAKPDARVEVKGAPKDEGDAKGAARKGITIVQSRPAVKKPKPPLAPLMPPGVGRLLDAKNPVRKPLIPSGPKAANVRPLGSQTAADTPAPIPAGKTPFSPEQLEEFRVMLTRKRAELLGDVHALESQALQADAGSLSNMPSHLADQGSEAYDQSLSLDLAAADRKLIREIDDALRRIAAGTFGICEVTGKPIKLERLRELPWARHSIEAAREIERQSMRAL